MDNLIAEGQVDPECCPTGLFIQATRDGRVVIKGTKAELDLSVDEAEAFGCLVKSMAAVARKGP